MLIKNSMNNLNNLTLTSTLADLPNFTYHIEEHSNASVLLEVLDKNPELPGGIVTHNSQVVGMFSRQRIERAKILPSWRQSYKDYPIRKLLQTVENPPLILADNFLINSAIKVALDRYSDEIFEPIVVLFANGNSGLIKMADLFLAQTYLLQLTIIEITELKNSRPSVSTNIAQNVTKSDVDTANLPPKSQYLIHKIKSKLHDRQEVSVSEASPTTTH
jgi:hypothetical protein